MMNRPFLYKQGVEEKDLYHNGRIKIISAEQFVPLWLVNYGLNTFPKDQRLGNIPDTSTRCSIPVSSETVGKIYGKSFSRQGIKDILVSEFRKILNTPLPKEYSFINTKSGPVDTISHSSIGRVFTGGSAITHLVEVINSTGVIVALGVLGYLQPNCVYGFYKSAKYNLTNTSVLIDNRVEPNAVTLIKYKWLARARACYFLKYPLDIPLTDIKVVRVANFSTTTIKEQYTQYIAPILKNLDMTIEYKTAEEIKKYLFPTFRKMTAKETLEKAIKNYKQTEPHVVF